MEGERRRGRTFIIVNLLKLDSLTVAFQPGRELGSQSSVIFPQTELFSNCRAAAAADFRDLGFNCVVKEPHQEVVRSGFMFVGP